MLINVLLNLEFLVGLEEFIEFACSKPKWMDGNKIKCPCTLTKCRNRSYHQIDTVNYHLMKNGFIPGYYVWSRQWEMESNSIQNSGDAQPASESIENAYHSIWLWMSSGLISILLKYRMCKTREIPISGKMGKIVFLVKTLKFSRSWMMKPILPLESSREI